MLAQINFQVQIPAKTQDYYDGEFDAAIGLSARTFNSDYWLGYLKKTIETGNTPF